MANASRLAETLKKGEETLLSDWLAALKKAGGDGRISEADLQTQARQFLGLGRGGGPIRAQHRRAGVGGGPAFSRRHVPFPRSARLYLVRNGAFHFLAQSAALDAASRGPERPWRAAGRDVGGDRTDRCLGSPNGQSVSEEPRVHHRRQQEELLELSTPVVKLWDGVLALPMIGTLDSARTQIVMESLLQRIVETGSEIAIIDITGVPTVDTLVAQHLLKTVTAIRLMGADCIISGIRPQIAQTIVHLGIDLQGVTTKATLADALAVALERSGLTVVKKHAQSGDSAPMERIPILQMGEFLLWSPSRSTCTIGWR